jgi:hypothetical protein
MTRTDETTVETAQFFQPLVEFWTKSFEQNMEFTKTLMESGKQATDTAALRRRWFDALAESFDAYMRTPAFLETMQRNFQALTECKGKSEDLAQEVARELGIPRMSDIGGLFERLQSGQKALRYRLTAIESRVGALENRRHSKAS